MAIKLVAGSVRRTSAFAAASPYTIFARKRPDAQTNSGAWFSIGSGATVSQMLQFDTTALTVSVAAGAGNSTPLLTAVLGTWYDAAMVDNGTTVTGYMRETGNPAAMLSQSDGLYLALPVNPTIYIAADEFSEFFSGATSDFMLWTVALTAAEIEQQRKSKVPCVRLDKLYCYVPCDSAETVIQDVQGNARHFALNSGTMSTDPALPPITPSGAPGVLQNQLAVVPPLNFGRAAAFSGPSATPLTATNTLKAGETGFVWVTFDPTTCAVTGVTDNAAGGSSVYSKRGEFVQSTSIKVELWTTDAGAGKAATTVSAAFSGTNTDSGIEAAAYLGVVGLGRVVTGGAATGSASLSVTTQDANNFFVAGFGYLSNINITAGTGNLRLTDSDSLVEQSIVDNTVGAPGSVTCSTTAPSGTPWAGVGIELRTVGLPVFDNFNRADVNPLAGNWTTGGGTEAAMAIVGNAATPGSLSNDSGSNYTAITWPNDQYSKAKLYVTGVSGPGDWGPGLKVRGSTAARTQYRLSCNHAATNNVTLAKFIGEAYTVLSGWPVTQAWTDGDTWELRVIGTTLRVFLNGVQIGSNTTDASITAGSPGITYSSLASTASIDDWEGGVPLPVTFLNAGTPVRGTTSPTGDAFSVTNSGTNRCAFATIAYDNAAVMSVTGVTYGGLAMTKCGPTSQNTNSNERAEVWYLVNPPTGSNILAITVSGTITDIYRNLVAFTNVNQTTPVRQGTYFSHVNRQQYDASGLYSLIVSSNANDLSLTCLNGGGQGVATSTQTSDGVSVAGIESFGSDHATTAAASVTHTWQSTTIGVSDLAIVGFSIASTSAVAALPVTGPIGYFDEEMLTKALFDPALADKVAFFDTQLVNQSGGIQLAVPNTLSGVSTVSSFTPRRIQTPATVTLAGVSTVASFTPKRITKLTATVTLVGTSTITGAGTRQQRPTATLVGASTITGAGTRQQRPTATLAGVGSVSSFTPTRIQIPATVTLAGTSTVSSFTPKRITKLTATVTLAGGSTVASPTAWKIQRDAPNTLAGNSSINSPTAWRISYESKTLAGTSSVASFTPKRIQTPATVTLAGASTLTGRAYRLAIPASVTLVGTSTVSSVHIIRITKGTATLAGTSTIFCDLTDHIKLASATLNGASTITGAARVIYGERVTLAGTSTVAANAKRITPVLGTTLTGISTVTGRSYRLQIPATVTLVGASTITGRSYRIETPATVTLVGASTVAAAGTRLLRPTATLVGASTVSSFTPKRITKLTATVTLAGASTLTGRSYRVQIPSTVTLSGAGTLTGSCRAIFRSAGSCAGSSTVQGTIDRPRITMIGPITVLTTRCTVTALATKVSITTLKPRASVAVLAPKANVTTLKPRANVSVLTPKASVTQLKPKVIFSTVVYK